MKKSSLASIYLEFYDFLIKTGLSREVAEAVDSIAVKISLGHDNSYDPLESRIAFFFVKSGIVIEENTLSNGTVISCSLYGSGSIIFFPTVLLNARRNFLSIYRAFHKAELVLVHFSSLKILSKSYSTLNDYVYKGYAEQSLMERETTWFMNILDKRSLIIASLLSFGLHSESRIFSISVEQFSDMLGISRQYVNSVVRELIESGCLSKQSNEIYIVSPNEMISLLPETLTDTIKTLPKLSIFNLDGCFFGRCAHFLD